jgi:hypothetical protein
MSEPAGTPEGGALTLIFFKLHHYRKFMSLVVHWFVLLSLNTP